MVYVAVGISVGSIVAINNNPEAPIFKVADLCEFVPKLAEELKA